MWKKNLILDVFQIAEAELNEITLKYVLSRHFHALFRYTEHIFVFLQ